MATLAVDTPRDYELGIVNEFPVIAADIIYEGAAVGLDYDTGLARPLAAGDKFVGFAEQKADNAAGAAAAKNVRVKHAGAVKLTVTGAVITDVGQPVYATDDNTFVFSPAAASFIGIVRRWVATNVVIVEYGPDILDPYAGFLCEAVAGNKTLDVQDTGKLFFVTADNAVITLPAVEGMRFAVVNGAAFGAAKVSISPNANDMIEGPDLAGVDNKDLISTKATANRGDYAILEYGDSNGWIVTDMKGIWAMEP